MASSTKKTDNLSLATKLAIRNWLLSRMGIREVYLLDTCAGAGHVWNAMQEHVAVRQWVRCDIKPRQAGTLAMTATQAVRSIPLDLFNVIDIDPYGEPWEPYREVLQRVTKPMAIFLTHGHVMQAQVATSNLAAVGIPEGWPIPRNPAISAFIAQASLSATWKYARIDHSARVEFPRVSYYALGVTPYASEQTNG